MMEAIVASSELTKREQVALSILCSMRILDGIGNYAYNENCSRVKCAFALADEFLRYSERTRGGV